MSHTVQNKDVLTTGEVARLCNVAPRTVSKWFDSGQLRGYRIPGSKDRRIPVQHLIRFMKAHNIPLNGLESNRIRALLVDRDDELMDLLKKTLIENEEYDVQTARSAFEAGACLQEFKPSIMLIDIDLPGLDVREISRYLAGNADLQQMSLVAVSGSLTDGERQ